METINNMAAAAANAVWGKTETAQEPVSGETGDVSKGEPYDAGNKDLTTDTKTSNTVEEPKPAEKPVMADDKPREPEPEAKSLPVPDASAAKDSSSMPGDSTKAQNDVRDPEDPTVDSTKEEQRRNVDNTTGGTDDDSNPVKVEGPGPKPIEEVAKERHGDAGNIGRDDNGNDSGVDTGNHKEEEDEDEGDGPQKKSHGSGTGEQYVKSSGLHANGGDFDATKPGAGREADRLLEEMGMQNPSEVAAHKRDEVSPASGKEANEVKEGKEGKEKKGLRQKIKEKLHRE